MIMHVVTFTWRPDASEDQIRALTKELATLPSKIPALRSYHFGPDLRLRDGNADFAVAAVVDDADGVRGYLEHPAHVELVKNFVQPIVAGRNAVQMAIAD
ncbi:Dabb family protein [Fodinicola acaciae]|uniref:Dabb family protein n=1 Tax=Fodinicola acaciae TaxID=2681555 RepID=UPI0013D23A02|nr:Dabb family protein [Fodinicola acaciae]